MLPVEPHQPLLVLLRVGRVRALVEVHYVLEVLGPLLAQVCLRDRPQ